MLQISVAGEQLVMFLATGIVTFECVVNHCQFTLDLGELREGCASFDKQGAASQGNTFLWQVSDRRFASTLDSPTIRFKLADDQTKKRGFTRAVRANEANPFTFTHMPIEVSKQFLSTKR